ncbi:MAG: PilZ domain-containing protein [Acidobacteria bacterium]|nr:PilZ domain-containing protein [Acidobacteriota bacterium]
MKDLPEPLPIEFPKKMKDRHPDKVHRQDKRCTLFSELCLVYEGQSEELPVRLPDLSVKGMFINTGRYFPVGAVLKVRFRLSRLDRVIQARGEVRYCLPDVGIGVEFLDLTSEAARAIEKELQLFGSLS